MTKIQIIIGSTRTARVGKQFADWVAEAAKTISDVEFELVDLAEWKLPMFDEATPPMMGVRASDISKKWSAKISEADGFVIVTPEYNHSFPASLKNALDYLYAEWNNKPVAMVGYGVAGGVRSMEAIQPVLTALQLRMINNTVRLVIAAENYGPDGLIGLDELMAKNRSSLDGVLAELVKLAPKYKAFRETE